MATNQFTDPCGSFVWVAGKSFYAADLFALLIKYLKHVDEAAGTDFLPTAFADGRAFTEAEWKLLLTLSKEAVQ